MHRLFLLTVVALATSCTILANRETVELREDAGGSDADAGSRDMASDAGPLRDTDVGGSGETDAGPDVGPDAGPDMGPARTKVTSLAAGFGHFCAITEQGRTVCWGRNNDGVLGQDGVEFSATPVEVEGDFVQVFAGNRNTCGLDAEGRLFCWGQHETVGSSASVDVIRPTPVLSGARFTDVSIGHEHSCAVTDDGEVHCWGVWASGAIGFENIYYQQFPAAIENQPESFQTVTAGWFHTCGVATDGQAYCWGDNNRLGFPASEFVTSPTLVESSERFTQISASETQTCALNSDGTAFCWGYDYSGSNGDGEGVTQNEVVAVAGGLRFDQISAGWEFTCGVTENQDVYCWGRNGNGNLGNGGLEDSAIPTRTELPDGFVPAEVQAGGNSACAVSTEGELACWGSTLHGRFGNGDPGFEPSPAKIAGPFSDPTAVATGYRHGCVIEGTSDLSCFGSNRDSELGDTVSQDGDVRRLPGTWMSVDTNARHTCALSQDAVLHCWGANWSGQVGTSDIGSDITEPRPVLSNVSTDQGGYALGRDVTCAISGADLYCWGDNDFGQTGTGLSDEHVLAPTVVSGVPNPMAVAVGDEHACAVTSEGSVYCWGRNGDGQLGVGDEQNRSTPTLVPASLDAISVAAGDDHTCVATNTEVFCWGRGRSGELGVGETNDVSLPIATGVRQELVVASDHATCAYTVGGSVECWGKSDEGAVGSGIINGVSTPTDLGLSFVLSVDVSRNFGCATADGTDLFCWGDPTLGAFGDGRFSVVPVPVRVQF